MSPRLGRTCCGDCTRPSLRLRSVLDSRVGTAKALDTVWTSCVSTCDRRVTLSRVLRPWSIYSSLTSATARAFSRSKSRRRSILSRATAPVSGSKRSSKSPTAEMQRRVLCAVTGDRRPVVASGDEDLRSCGASSSQLVGLEPVQFHTCDTANAYHRMPGLVARTPIAASGVQQHPLRKLN